METPLRWGTVRTGRVQLVGLRRPSVKTVELKLNLDLVRLDVLLVGMIDVDIVQMSKDTVRIECPFCEHIVESPRDWIVQNGRVFCGTCCKAFDVSEEDLPKEISLPDFWD